MASVLGDSHHIFDSATVFALQINAGLYGDNVANLEQNVFGGSGKAGRFVDKETHTVAKAMAESAFVVFYAIDDIASHIICFI